MGASEGAEVARDKGLEAMLSDDLAGVSGLTEKAMFGGWAWLLHGNLLCGARVGQLLVRLGKDKDAWALEIPGVVPMVMHGRRISGWVRASAAVYGDDAIRRKLVKAAVEFCRSLPKK
jgi:hypothetical protein